jgi:hypothetical protein
MSIQLLKISVTPRGLLSKAEAAIFCGVPERHLNKLCPVKPVMLGDNKLRYDLRDLEKWIDSIKFDSEIEDVDAIVSQL